MRFLAAMGADLQCKNRDKQNLLHAAVIANKIDIFLYLLELIDPNETCEYGTSPLSLATQFGLINEERHVCGTFIARS